MWYKAKLHRKGVGIILALVLACIFVGCTGPIGPAGTPGAVGPTGPIGPTGEPAVLPGASFVVVPTVIDETTASMEVCGSGFSPSSTVVVTMVGTWTMKGYSITPTDPEIGASIVNEYGAFKITINLVRVRKRYDLVPGAYTLEVQSLSEPIVATTPLVVVEKEVL